MNIKRISFDTSLKPFRKRIGTMKPRIVWLSFTVFASVLLADCNDSNSPSDSNKKTDTIAQPNNQREQQEGEGVDDGKRGMDSLHRGMDRSHPEKRI